MVFRKKKVEEAPEYIILTGVGNDKQILKASFPFEDHVFIGKNDKGMEIYTPKTQPGDRVEVQDKAISKETDISEDSLDLPEFSDLSGEAQDQADSEQPIFMKPVSSEWQEALNYLSRIADSLEKIQRGLGK